MSESEDNDNCLGSPLFDGAEDGACPVVMATAVPKPLKTRGPYNIHKPAPKEPAKKAKVSLDGLTPEQRLERRRVDAVRYRNEKQAEIAAGNAAILALDKSNEEIECLKQQVLTEMQKSQKLELENLDLKFTVRCTENLKLHLRCNEETIQKLVAENTRLHMENHQLRGAAV